jgi:hypothetical protein
MLKLLLVLDRVVVVFLAETSYKYKVGVAICNATISLELSSKAVLYITP